MILYIKKNKSDLDKLIIILLKSDKQKLITLPYNPLFYSKTKEIDI